MSNRGTTNLTLSLPRDLMLRLKHRAVDAGSSVSQLVRDLVERALVEDDPYERARRRQAELMDRGFPMDLERWTPGPRDELHGR
ncbi:MAG: ribbon-helix-helix protein, CopG family [Vulcanimicrobiota bacterium]